MPKEKSPDAQQNYENNEDRLVLCRKNEREEPFVRVSFNLLNRGRHLTPSAKWLYVTLRSFKNEVTKLTYPSYKKIMERGGLSRNAVAKGLAELEQWGWIQRIKTGDRVSTQYEFYFPALMDKVTKKEVGDQTLPRKEWAKEYAKEQAKHRAKKTKTKEKS